MKTYLLITHHDMKAYWGIGGIAPRILNLGIDGAEWSASLPALYSQGVIPGYQLNRRLSGTAQQLK
jgi:hypothetical protein